MNPNSCVESKSQCEADCKGYRCNQQCTQGNSCTNIESNCYGSEIDCKNTCKGYRCQNAECRQGTTPCTAQEITEQKCFLTSTCGTGGCVANCQTGYILGTSGSNVCIPSVKPKCVSSDNNNYYYKVAGKVNNDTWGIGQTCHSEGTNCNWKSKNDCQTEFENTDKSILGNKDVVNSDSDGPRCQENKQARLGNNDPWKDDLNGPYKWWLHITGDFNKTNLTPYNPPSPESGTCWSGDNWRSNNWSCRMWKNKGECEQELGKKFFTAT